MRTEEKTMAFLHWEKLVQSNDFEQADRFYEKMLETKQADAEVCFVMGLWYRQQQQYKKSTDAFIYGLGLKPNSSESYYELGNTVREMGNDELAEVQYKRCLALKPKDIDAMYCLGQVQAAQDKIAEAKKSFCETLKLSNYVQEMIAIAVEFSGIDMPDDAIEIYFAALMKEPDNAYLFSNLGVEYAEQKEFDDAVYCHERAIQLDDQNADVWYNVACTYSLMGEPLRGLIALEKAITIDPGNIDFAVQDDELDNLRKHKRYWKLVKQDPGADL